jgi:hypothetical protein
MNDAERDAWLREALRHAPDSQALPPQGVSDTILARARAATRRSPRCRRALHAWRNESARCVLGLARATARSRPASRP